MGIVCNPALLKHVSADLHMKTSGLKHLTYLLIVFNPTIVANLLCFELKNLSLFAPPDMTLSYFAFPLGHPLPQTVSTVFCMLSCTGIYCCSPCLKSALPHLWSS